MIGKDCICIRAALLDTFLIQIVFPSIGPVILSNGLSRFV